MAGWKHRQTPDAAPEANVTSQIERTLAPKALGRTSKRLRQSFFSRRGERLLKVIAMTDSGTTSLDLELDLSGHETDEELETAVRANLPQILEVFGRSLAESAWGKAQDGTIPSDGKAEFVRLMQQDYVASTATQDQESLLRDILVQVRQRRDAVRGS